MQIKLGLTGSSDAVNHILIKIDDINRFTSFPCLINKKRLESNSITTISELVMDTLHANI